jgi:uncharacterized ion transporter superfamily protein YfcC
VIAFDEEERKRQRRQAFFQTAILCGTVIVHAIVSENNQEIFFGCVPPETEPLHIFVISMLISGDKYVAHTSSPPFKSCSRLLLGGILCGIFRGLTIAHKAGKLRRTILTQNKGLLVAV